MIRGGKVSRYIIHAHTACTGGTGRPRDFTEVVKVKSNQSKVSSQQLLRLCFPRLRLWLRFLVVITALGTRRPNTALSRNWERPSLTRRWWPWGGRSRGWPRRRGSPRPGCRGGWGGSWPSSSHCLLSPVSPALTPVLWLRLRSSENCDNRDTGYWLPAQYSTVHSTQWYRGRLVSYHSVISAGAEPGAWRLSQSEIKCNVNSRHLAAMSDALLLFCKLIN